ncbi:hypothetical protein AAFP29_17220 [Gordonia sp. CPCC 205333]
MNQSDLVETRWGSKVSDRWLVRRIVLLHRLALLNRWLLVDRLLLLRCVTRVRDRCAMRYSQRRIVLLGVGLNRWLLWRHLVLRRWLKVGWLEIGRREVGSRRTLRLKMLGRLERRVRGVRILAQTRVLRDTFFTRVLSVEGWRGEVLCRNRFGLIGPGEYILGG